MKKQLNIFIILIIVIISGNSILYSQDCALDTSTTTYWPAPVVNKPGYLTEITDATFGTKITRITGNPGDPIPNIPGKVWANDQLRHGYSKRQPWNSDQSMIYLGRHYPNLWLDGTTYQVLFTRSKPSSAIRWSNTDPHIMYYTADGTFGKWDVVNNVTTQLVDLSGYSSCTFGKGEGNFTNDGTKVVVIAIRNSDNHEVIFIVNVANQTKGNDIDVDSYSAVTNCTISPLGNYIILVGDFGVGSDRVQVRNSSGTILWTETSYGLPSHFDTQIDQNGDEVIAGVGKTSPYSGKIIKRVLSNGNITVVNDFPYAAHTSGRAINRPGWVFVSYQTRTSNYAPYVNELIAVKLDGSRIERIAHMHENNFTYVAEAHGVPSPDGLRAMWASDWDNNDYPVQSYVADYRDKVIGGGSSTIDVSVNSSSDDAEEYSSGASKFTSPDLELVNDGTGNDQTVGMRFTGIAIPQGATITAAYVEFEAKDNTSNTTSLTIKGEDADNSPTFTSATNNITNRTTTSTSVSWTPGAWTDGGVEQTPEVKNIVQEIVNRTGWNSGNALSIIISGTGKRRAWSYDGSGTPPKIHIVYSTTSNGSLDVSVGASSDDAEEYSSGASKLTSPDLELVNDGTGNDQTVGMRFTGITIPQGATITAAYVEFEAKDNTSNTTSLTIKGEDVDNSPTFTSATNNITNRTTTSTNVSWTPSAWSDGAVEQTPEIKDIVQEIVNRTGWNSGNALSIIISGTGKRRAWSYDGSGIPPKIHIEYSGGLSKNVISKGETVPSDFSIVNYPNPFNPSTNIQFSIPQSGNVKIVIYDIIGREVSKIVEKHFEKGSYIFNWNARDKYGNRLSSGMYIARIKAGSYMKSIKMLLMK